MGPALRLHTRKGVTSRLSIRMIAKRKAREMARIRAANRLARQAAASGQSQQFVRKKKDPGSRERKQQLATLPDFADGEPPTGKIKKKPPKTKVTSKSTKKQKNLQLKAPLVKNDDNCFVIIVGDDAAENHTSGINDNNTVFSNGEENVSGKIKKTILSCSSIKSKPPSAEFLRVLKKALGRQSAPENLSSHVNGPSIGEESNFPAGIVYYDEETGVFKDLTHCKMNETNQIRPTSSNTLDESSQAQVSALLEELFRQKLLTRPRKSKKKAPPSGLSATPCTGFHECRKCGKKVSAKKRPQVKKPPKHWVWVPEPPEKPQ